MSWVDRLKEDKAAANCIDCHGVHDILHSDWGRLFHNWEALEIAADDLSRTGWEDVGADPMEPVVPELLSAAVGPVLRIWVDTGAGYEQLTDQPVGSVPFSLGGGGGDRSTGSQCR